MFTKANIAKHSPSAEKRFCRHLGKKYGESKCCRNNVVNILFPQIGKFFGVSIDLYQATVNVMTK